MASLPQGFEFTQQDHTSSPQIDYRQAHYSHFGRLKLNPSQIHSEPIFLRAIALARPGA